MRLFVCGGAGRLGSSYDFEGRKRNRDADVLRAALAAERVVRHLDRAG